MSSKHLLIATSALLLAGCQTTDPVSGSPDPAFGEATKWNKAAMIVDPDPVYPEGSAQPGDSGEKGAKAVERYRKDGVKDVQTLSSGGGSGGGSGGSGGGSGPQ